VTNISLASFSTSMKHVDMSTSTSTVQVLWFHTQVQRPMTTSLVHIRSSPNKSVCTHVQSASSADVAPTVKWVIPSSQSESDATTNTLTTAE